MQQSWQQMDPKDMFIVRYNAPFSNLDQKTFTYLYQPIIGVNAYSLYMSLWGELAEQKISEPIMHSMLLSILNIGVPQLYQARLKLEAVGLLKTAIKKGSYGNDFVYTLVPPVTSTAFFQDDLLSILLYETVGEDKFKQLQQRFILPTINLQDFQEITKSFLEVFQISMEKLGSSPVENLPNQELMEKRAKIELSIQDFDWDFFIAQINRAYLNQNQLVEHKEAILILHKIYGVNELEMAQYVLNTVDLATGMLDIKKLQKMVIGASRQKQEKVQITDTVTQELLATEAAENHFVDRLSTFSSADQEIIRLAYELSPFDFLTSIKKQTGGFVAQTEEWSLQQLMSRTMLPPAVVNILIHYLLAVQGKPVLNQASLDTIANDWSKDNVQTPEDAIEKVKQFYADKETKKLKQQTKQSNYRNNKPIIKKETLPDWAKENRHETVEKPMDDLMQKQIDERIKNLRKGKVGE